MLDIQKTQIKNLSNTIEATNLLEAFKLGAENEDLTNKQLTELTTLINERVTELVSTDEKKEAVEPYQSQEDIAKSINFANGAITGLSGNLRGLSNGLYRFGTIGVEKNPKKRFKLTAANVHSLETEGYAINTNVFHTIGSMEYFKIPQGITNGSGIEKRNDEAGTDRLKKDSTEAGLRLASRVWNGTKMVDVVADTLIGTEDFFFVIDNTKTKVYALTNDNSKGATQKAWSSFQLPVMDYAIIKKGTLAEMNKQIAEINKGFEAAKITAVIPTITSLKAYSKVTT